MLKKLFGKGEGSTQPDAELTVEDLIVLERWPEAIERLQARVKTNPRDLHAHLKLADVYAGANQGRKALDQYLLVADTYTEEGFLDKAVALLSKISRLAPAARIRLGVSQATGAEGEVIVASGRVPADDQPRLQRAFDALEVAVMWDGWGELDDQPVMPGADG